MGIEADEQFDVVVIGSGLGGLTAAACLAASGRKVVVLEQHDLAGGNSQVFRREGDAYEFDVGVHYLGGCGPNGAIPTILRGLGVGDRVSFRELDPEGFDTLVFSDFTFRLPKGWDAYRERFAEHFPDEVDAFDAYIAKVQALGSEFGALLIGGETPTIDAMVDMTLDDLFEECGFSRRARLLLSHLSISYGAGPAHVSALMHGLSIAHFMAGAFYPEGGGQVIAARLVEVIEFLGGEVRTLTRVDQILVEDQKVQGVRARAAHSDATTTIAAPIVLSNADLRRTLLEMIGAPHLSAATTAMAERAIMSLGLVSVYVVVNRDLSAEIPNSNYYVIADDADPYTWFEDLEAGRASDRVPYVFMSFPSLKDPENTHLCAPGQTNFQIMTLAPRGYGAFGIAEGPATGGRYRREESYRELKEWYTERLLDAAERALGPLRDDIAYIECATPLTQERYTLSTGGTSYGLAHTPEQSARRRPGFRTEIEGLYLVGANTMALHGIAGVMAGGMHCAGEVLDRPLLAEVFFGANLVEADQLPPFDPDADPVEICRGAALRQRRSH